MPFLPPNQQRQSTECTATKKKFELNTEKLTDKKRGEKRQGKVDAKQQWTYNTEQHFK